jgi:hypothetical protein
LDDITLSILLIAGLVLMVGVFFLIRFVSGTASRQWTRHRAETVDKWAADGVEFRRGPLGARIAGLESMGVSRAVRGVGYAAITTTDLRLTRSVPAAVYCIPFEQISRITIQPTFLGLRSRTTPFLVVSFEQDGQPDKVGFQVTDFEVWARDLAQAAGIDMK